MNTTQLPSFLDLKSDELRPGEPWEMQMFIRLSLMSIAKVREEFGKVFPAPVLKERLEWGGVQISDQLFCWLVTLTYGSPGLAVLWAWTMRKLYKDTLLTMDNWVEAFPDGIPTEEGFIRVWEAQKQPGAPLGNALDIEENWK